MKRRLRGGTLLVLDAVSAVLALYLALLLRLEGDISLHFTAGFRMAVPVLLACRLLPVLAARLHRWSALRSGLPEAVRLASAALVGSVLFVVLMRLHAPRALPRTVYALEYFLAVSLMASYRFGPRVVLAWAVERAARLGAARALIVGAGREGTLLARDLLDGAERAYFVVGFVDASAELVGTRAVGKPVLGGLADLPALVDAHRIGMVLVADPALGPAQLQGLLDACRGSRVRFKTVPASFTARDQKITAALLHDLSPEDLLPRDAVSFDPAEIGQRVRGRRALVTGAAGSIGSEICRQLAASGVAQLVMVDINENELYLNARRLVRDQPGVEVHAQVADIRERARLFQLCRRYRPQDVFHAAAHKHVPLMEDAPAEAVKNNVFGTLNVARVADQCAVERLVVISTDKAVKPTSVMGVTKRIAEMAVRDLARSSRTRMSAVRFGNVLGSAGSVVPIFKEQIARGGPVTVTHPDCRRYFMTIPEAVGLVLIAGLGGYGELCVLDMGEPIRIPELARNMIVMAGLVPGDDIEIVYTGLRPGEKMYEELLTEEEEDSHQVRDRIKVARSPAPPAELARRLEELAALAQAGDAEAIIASMQAIVPSYRPARVPAPPPRSEAARGAQPAQPAPHGQSTSAAVPSRPHLPVADLPA